MKLWTQIRLAWHTGRAMRHADLADSLAAKLGMCGECGGTENKHFLSCSVWPFNSKRR